MAMPNTNSPRFHAQIDVLEERLHETMDRLQTGYMLKAIAEMAEVCPSVASFDLDVDRRLECRDAQDAEGNTVSQEVQEALDSVFHYRDEADYSLFVGRTVVVADVIAHWVKYGGRDRPTA